MYVAYVTHEKPHQQRQNDEISNMLCNDDICIRAGFVDVVVVEIISSDDQTGT